MSIWNWVQHFGSNTIYKRNRLTSFNIDETIIHSGSKHIERVNQYFKKRIESFDDYYSCIKK